MTEDARTKRRPYDAPRRRAQGESTRARVVAAAARVFLTRGYAGATLPVIATEAGVAVKTVYRAASGKTGLLIAAVYAAARAQTPEGTPSWAEVLAEPNPRRKLELYAAALPALHARVGPLLRVLDAAASADPELATLRDELNHRRLEGTHHLATQLSQHAALRPGLTVQQAADILWTLDGPAVHNALVHARGWPATAYSAWIAQQLSAALLSPTAGSRDDPAPCPPGQGHDRVP